MKNYLLLLLVACQCYTALAQDNRQEPYMTKPLSGIKQVFVKTSGGSISVSGASGQASRVEVYISGNNGNGQLSKDEIKKRLENYDLDVAVNGSELHATAKSKNSGFFNWKNSLNISFKVFVSKEVATSLNTSGGSIHLDNLNGKQEFETSGGSLHVDQLTGVIHGRTSGGSINVSNSGQDIDLQTSGGSITAANCQGHIKLGTSGGSLRLEGLKGTINATTSGGSIHGNDINGELVTGTSGGSINLSKLSCALAASTSGGSFHVQFDNVGKYVKIDANGGGANLDLPAKQGVDLDIRGDRVNTNIADNFNGSKEKEKVQGKLNGGGPLVEVRVNGRVTLNLN